MNTKKEFQVTEVGYFRPGALRLVMSFWREM
jgi:hypothetical protein